MLKAQCSGKKIVFMIKSNDKKQNHYAVVNYTLREKKKPLARNFCV